MEEEKTLKEKREENKNNYFFACEKCGVRGIGLVCSNCHGNPDLASRVLRAATEMDLPITLIIL